MKMNFPNYFADAESTYDDADFIIFGVPYDKTSSFRPGAKLGPDEIRKASWNFETYHIKSGVDLKDIKFHDYGNLKVEDDTPAEMVKKVTQFSKEVLSKNKFPIAIGGEHSITSGVIKAFPSDTAVLSLDAHLDFRNEYEDDVYNHACVTRRIADYIKIGNIAVFGVRSAEKEEFMEAKKQGLFYFDVFEIKEKGFSNALGEIKKYLQNRPLYLTLDIDVLDPAYAPGTSTPEPFGLNSFELLEIIESFSSQLIGFDVVEVCPPYDKGETSLLAAKIIRLVIDRVWSSRNG